MNRNDDGNSSNGQSKKSELLPTGENANAIIEVLVAMFRGTRNSEDLPDDDAKDEHASR